MSKAATALTVTAPKGRTDLVVMDKNDQLPVSFALKATTAKHHTAIRIGGGCGNMGHSDKTSMVEYFLEAFLGYKGVAFSGGTRALTEEGEVDLMITELPGLIAHGNPGAVALGTAPRTGRLGLIDESQLVFDEHNTRPNVAMSLVLVVQNGPERPAEWDGDLDQYFELMRSWQRDANFSPVGGVFWNGGGVTKTEIKRCANEGWPTIIVRGSGRAADEFAEKLDAQDPEFLAEIPRDHKLVVVDRSDPQTLRKALHEFGFLQSS